MSGSGGGYSPSPSNDVNCAQLRVRTQLTSPVPEVIAKLKEGQILQITYHPPRGPLQAISSKGDVAGSIVTSKQVDIINCINEGYTFKAEIISINGGKCEIEITPK